MDSCDVLIVGGGPAGSSCAWAVRGSGLDVVILDKQVFPRDKICGGWITPAVLTELEIDPREYSRDRVLQPITAFRTGCIDGSACETNSIETHYGAPVSYGIRRREFDDYLLKRSGARLLEGVALTSLERTNNRWIVNGAIETRLVIGAGGHFCPVARLIGTKPGPENAVVAQEAEFEMDAAQIANCRVSAEVPEIYFCADLKGYGWCFRKQNFLNIGLGRLDSHRLPDHVAAFLRFLKSAERIGWDLPSAPHGHAYLLYGVSQRDKVQDGLLLTGDAAGLAYAQSGEGIRPAIESGLLAARVILAAEGRYRAADLEPYRDLIVQRFGDARREWFSRIGRHLPSTWIRFVARTLLRSKWFARNILLDRWFLHAGEPILDSPPKIQYRNTAAIEA